MTAYEIYEKLLACYGEPQWWSLDPYEVMFEAILVQNTTWSSVKKTRELIGESLSPEWVECLSHEDLEVSVRPCGFYTAKSRTIKDVTAWYKGYDYDAAYVRTIPMDTLRQELMSIRGIGAETADVILVFSFYKPCFIIDAYTRRFLLRLGFSFPDDAAIKDFFEKELTPDAQLYGWYHWLIIDHCITRCRKKPTCEGCPFYCCCNDNIGDLKKESPDDVC
jgi:endonuclease-3 related protein